jgi:hypothetical protein
MKNNFASHTHHNLQSAVLLDVLVRDSAAVLQILARKYQALHM